MHIERGRHLFLPPSEATPRPSQAARVGGSLRGNGIGYKMGYKLLSHRHLP